MSPSEKADELLDKISWAMVPDGQSVRTAGIIKHAKQCAIICVEQIIDGIHGVNEELELTSNVDISSHLTYYEEVLEQIKNS